MNPAFAIVSSRPYDERSHAQLHAEESEWVGHLPEILHGEDLEALAVANSRVNREVVEPLLEQERPLHSHYEGVQKNLDDSADVTCRQIKASDCRPHEATYSSFY